MKKFIIAAFIITIAVLAIVAIETWGLFPYIIINGKILDEAGKPIVNAKVYARYGLSYEAPVVTTGSNGKFGVSVYADRWDNHGKGSPSFTVSVPGYREYWGHFVNREQGGLTFYNVTVKLQQGPQEPHVHEDL